MLPGAGAEAAKRGSGVACGTGADGRMHLHLSLAATVSRGKAVLLAVTLAACAAYFLAPLAALEPMRARIARLEDRLANRVQWLVKHRDHLADHLRGKAVDGDGGGGKGTDGVDSGSSSGSGMREVDASDGLPTKLADGRRHLWVAPGQPSRLALALAPATGLAAFDDHYLCGTDEGFDELSVTRKTVALAAITWMAPASLANSMTSWADGGLLDIVDERMIFLNSPLPQDRALSEKHGFDIYTTDERGGNVMVGPALAYLVGNSTADYILLMEKDFALTSSRDTMMREMYNGVQHLARGVHSYRLRGKSDFPAEGMPDCCAPATPPTCPFHSSWRSAGYFSDHMNWLFIYCDPDILEHSNGRLAQCTSEPNAPDSYCYTSGETNWSNNPVLFPRAWFHERLRQVALKDFERNNYFEFNVMLEWLAWKPPAIVCSSMQGIFSHREVDQ